MPTLDFKGKQHIYAHHLAVPYRPLVPDEGRSVNAGGVDDNLIIHGDNLYALKALLPRYAGRVKCIYIDPPYNTGNEGWVYNDKVNSPLMRQWLKDNGLVDKEDLERHDKWLCMMWPRLQLLWELLSDDGVIFVSIDDNEQHHLRMLMDEIWGEDNFYAMCNWTARNKPMNSGSARFKIQKSEEYILAYGKIPMPEHTPFVLEEKEALEYPCTTDDGRTYREEEVQQRKNIGIKRSEKMVFSILGMTPQDGYRWTIGQDTAERLIRENKVFVRKGKLIRVFFSDEELDKRYHPLWANFNESCGTSEAGKKKLDEIVEGHGMETVKPIDVIKKIIFHFAGKNALVLDSFAGSGTTAHAILALNKEDGGNRKFILVECEDYADSTTAERVRRVINGVPNAKDDALRQGLGGSFTYCTLGDPIDPEAMLTGEALPDYSALAAYLLYTASGISAGAAALQPLNDDSLFHSNHTTDYYLLYEPDLDYLRSNAAMLNLERARRISTTAKQNDRKALVFGPGKYIGQAELTKMGITFCQLPYELHRAL